MLILSVLAAAGPVKRGPDRVAPSGLRPGLPAADAQAPAQRQPKVLLPPPDACSGVTALPWGHGESLEFKVGYRVSSLWVGAGDIRIDMRAASRGTVPAWHGRAMARTKPAFDRVFRVRDTYATWMDASSLQPLRFERDVDEGGFTFHRSYDFEPDSGLARSTYRRKEKHEVERVEGLSACVQDLLSAVYRLRRLDVSGLEPGDTLPFHLLVDGQPESLYVRFVGREILRTKHGKFRTLVFRPVLLRGDYFRGGEELTVWLSDDANRLPLRAEAGVLVGSLRAELRAFEGPRHPVGARVGK